MALNKYLILCLVVVQPNFKINEVLNIIVIELCGSGGGGGGGVPLNVDVLGHFRLSLRFRLDRNILSKGGKLYFLR